MTGPYPGQIGYAIKFNISAYGKTTTGATTTVVYAERPDGSTVTWNASIYDVDNLQYITQAGDLISTPGIYKVQAGVAWNNGPIFLSDTATLIVSPLWQ